MATDTTVKHVLALMATNYPEQVAKMSETELTMRRQLFVVAFADIDDDILKAAALRHITTSIWFPKVYELRRAAADLIQPTVPDPMEAWGAVLAEIRRTGSYGTPCFADPLTAAVVRQMGWRDLCLSEEATADRARFVDAYARQAQRAREQQVMPIGLRDGAMTVPVDRQLTSSNQDARALLQGVTEKLSRERN